jgi:hypothetical protein
MSNRNSCTPAHPVIEGLGGRASVAEHLGISVSTLSRWCAEHPRGTAGRIPQRHWPALLDLARRTGKRLTLKTLAGL